jgi:hypothetical protein
MSSRSFRRVLAGSLVAAFLVLSSPVSAEAADLSESPDVACLWTRAWQWLTAQILPPEEETAAGSGSDAGWTLDPDG